MSELTLRPTAPQPETLPGHTLIDPDEMSRVWDAGQAEAAATYIWIVRCAQLGVGCSLETLQERYSDADPAVLQTHVNLLIDIGLVRWEGGAQ